MSFHDESDSSRPEDNDYIPQQEEDRSSSEDDDESAIDQGSSSKVRFVPGLPDLVSSAAPPALATARPKNPSRGSRRRAPGSAAAYEVIGDSHATKAERRDEIGPILEHLIVHGNYYRHLHWRMQQWKKEPVTTTVAADPPAAVSDIPKSLSRDNDDSDDGSENDDADDDEDDGENGPAKKKQKKTHKRDEATVTNGITHADKSVDVHASDARLYHNQGQEPDRWPKLPALLIRETPMSDTAWKDELSDNYINPIAFSQMRLSPHAGLFLLSLPDEACTVLEGAADDEEDLLYHAFERRCGDASPATCHDDNQQQLPFDRDSIKSDPTAAKSTAARVMLLHCWERAVHAASTSIPVDVVVPSATNAFEHGAIPPPPTPRGKEHDEPSINGEDEDTAAPPQSKCNGATIAEEAKQQRMTINLLQRILETEVQAQMQQLVEVVLKEAEAFLHKKRQSQQSMEPLNAFDVLSIWEERLQSSRELRTHKAAAAVTGQRDATQETLEVQTNEPPLLINYAVLEAARIHIVDRYAKVPR